MIKQSGSTGSNIVTRERQRFTQPVLSPNSGPTGEQDLWPRGAASSLTVASFSFTFLLHLSFRKRYFFIPRAVVMCQKAATELYLCL